MRIERAYIFFFGGLFVAGSAQAAPPLSPDGSTEAIINMIEARLPQLASSPNGIVNAIFSAGILQAANAADESLPPPSDKLRADLKDMADSSPFLPAQSWLYVPALHAGGIQQITGADHVEYWITFAGKGNETEEIPLPDILRTDLSDNTEERGGIGTDGHNLIAVMGGVCDYTGSVTVGVQAWDGTVWSRPYVMSAPSSCMSNGHIKIGSVHEVPNWKPLTH